MSIKALQGYTFTAKYARYNQEKQRRETWIECCDRVMNMHLEKYKDCGIDEDIIWAFDRVKKKLVLGSQRALQYGGEPILRKNERIFNCSYLHIDKPESFQHAVYLLLCGCGVGFSVQEHHINQLPKLVKEKNESVKITIDDSIEGWSDAIGALVCSYFVPCSANPWSEYSGKNIQFDYTKIRKKGSPLSHGCGKAPGPDPLKKAIQNIRSLLDNLLNNGEFADRKLNSVTVYDIIMHGADAVVSGGHRRSATICIFSPNDDLMMNAKTGNWFNENPQRGRSNNSALLVRSETTKEQFLELIKRTKEFGEPGFIFADSNNVGFNPCAEISFMPHDKITGLTGVAFCNLCEINGKKIINEEIFAEAARASAIIGTLQAGYTDFPYLGQASENIAKEEALLGCSITGMMENPDIIFDPKIQRRMAKIINKTNEEIAKKIGINPAARTTCVKPAGTTSCILGSSSGIHPHHAKRYIRRVQANTMENVYKFFQNNNPKACEKSVWSANNTDDVISFCIEVPAGSKTKNQVSAIELLELVKLTQQNWVECGTRPERCIDPCLRHNVSNTINVKPEEWEEVSDYIYKNRNYFAGISLLPVSGDKDYPQAPFSAIYLPHEMVSHYGDCAMFVSGLIEEAMQLFEDNLWQACDVLNGNIQPHGSAKTTWVERCKRFASKYNGGDIKKLSYCMKDVYNYKAWLDLQRTFKDVDYTQLIETEDNTKIQETVSCAGGACEIV